MKNDIQKQIEKQLQKIVEQLEKGKDVQISFQKSKNQLHIKTITTEKI